MDKQKNGELSRMFGYAGKFHVLTVLGCVLSWISTILSMLPFVCIWLVIRDLIQAFAAGDISLATGSAHYAWMAVVFAAASILIYFIALNCTHLAAFRTATNMRKSAIHHIVTLPLGYFGQNASGRLRKIIDDRGMAWRSKPASMTAENNRSVYSRPCLFTMLRTSSARLQG